MPQTMRITKSTFSTEHTAPDGSHRFGTGLIVAVGEGAGQVDESSAKRWQRAGFAEPFDGEPGTQVTNEDVAKTPGELAAEIANLQALLQRATAETGGTHVGYISRSVAPHGNPQTPAGLPQDQPIGTTPYKDPDAPHPFAHADLTDKQRTNLERAGFTSRAHVERATDEELIEALGGGKGSEAAVARLRGG